ncbi:hypothetical protein AVEN_166066-1 [Araneus ventricosus]|uniref:Uncharacterized protein n=1 Tax=Araneus ventricosus TaxID=182803 RepID=A0A4Y2PYV2_ARAVE|nr:hypothetical protein AVEN_166066-1 [Araneus ventricosus]
MEQHREALSSLLGSSPLVLHGVNRLTGFGMAMLQGSSSSKICQSSSGLTWSCCRVPAPLKSVSHHRVGHGLVAVFGFGMGSLLCSGLAWARCCVLAPLKSVSHLDGCPANGSKST